MFRKTATKKDFTSPTEIVGLHFAALLQCYCWLVFLDWAPVT